MITIDIPGRERPLSIRSIVLDYNGTVALDGAVLPGLGERIAALRELAEVYVLTADTYGTVAAQCAPWGVHVMPFPRPDAAACKAEIVRELGSGVCCLGNGWNDIPMFDLAELSIAVLEGEGLCAALVSHSDVLVRCPQDGLDLLLHPDRLRATLRG